MPQSQSSISGAVRRSEGRSREGSLRIDEKGDANEKEGAQGPAKSNNPADFGNDKIVLVQFEDGRIVCNAAKSVEHIRCRSKERGSLA
jgi:hypothetical protein